MASVTNNLIEQVTIGNQTAQIASTAYGVCETAANVSAKTVDMDGFVAAQGVTVHIKFTNANTVDNPTLNVNDTGGFAIMQYGDTHVENGTLIKSWPAGAVIAFTLVRNGNAWNWVRDFGVNTDTTYDIQHTYDNTSEDPISGKGVKAALETLDVSNITSGLGTNKTITELSETDGKIAATAELIEIAESQVTNLGTDLAAKANLSGATFTGPVILAGSPTSANEAATKSYVDSIVGVVASPMHYLGDATVTITPGTGNNPDTITITNLPQSLPSNYTPTTGDIISDNTSHKEFIFTGSGWRELGDEGSYALKTKTDTAIKTASVSYTAPTLSNNTFSGLTSVDTAGTLPTLSTEEVTITGLATEGSVTTASVSNGTLVINIGTAPTKATTQTFNAVQSFSQGAMPTFNSGSTTVGISGGDATLSVTESITVVVP